jgi:hypothetical protein
MKKRKKKDETQFRLPPKLMEKLDWLVPVISFFKIFIPSYVFDGLLCRNWPFWLPNHGTLLTDNSIAS